MQVLGTSPEIPEDFVFHRHRSFVDQRRTSQDYHLPFSVSIGYGRPAPLCS